ncbi:MAG TPA: TIGR01458 family HAD-type hydrolase [Candidatus Polarisedimenticolia bacterium]|nr:TIGR01458 family HAD-type hydrolase [Candidatus Polarisedimenticolia bacterium]
MMPAAAGALIDIDGTLLDGDAAIPGAAGAVKRLRDLRIPFRFSTNTTRRPRRVIAEVLTAAGIAARTEEIVSPASLARRRILDSGSSCAMLLIPDAAREDFEGVAEDRAASAWVVVGDLGRDFTFDRLDQAFHRLREGARLLALHKNRSWRPGPGRLTLDAGPFVAALEYAAQVEAEVVGKPSRAFFELALQELGLPAGSVVSVGDSLPNDVEGAARAGCRTALVRTGVFDPGELERSAFRPTAVLDSIADLRL